MSRLAQPAARLTAGSPALARRLTTRATAWVARGRRTDLTGWRSTLGCWARLALLALGLYLLWRIISAIPNLLWLLTAGWLATAWRAGKPSTELPANTASAAPAATPQAVLVHWLDRLTRGRAGIHLDELHATLTRHPDLATLTRPQMRAWLDRHHITVDRTLRVGAVAGRSGISRTTVEALLQALPPLPETSPAEPPLHASDLPQSPVESSVEQGGERPVEQHFEDVVRLFA